MLNIARVLKPWKEAASLNAQINLYGFWDATTFLTKSGDLGVVLRVGGVDYESLDTGEQEYAVKRLEAALKAFGPGFHVYQYLFKRHRPEIPFGRYDDPVVATSVEQRRRFFDEKRDQLYSVEIFYCVLLEGARSKTGIGAGVARLITDPAGGLSELHSQFSNKSMKVLLASQIQRDCALLHQRVQAFVRQLADFVPIELLDQSEQLQFFRRLLNFDDWRITGRPKSTQFLDYQAVNSDIEAERDHLRVGDHFVRVLTMKEAIAETRPLVLDALLKISANFHVVTEWAPLPMAKARKEVVKRRRHFNISKTGFVSQLGNDVTKTNPRDVLVDESKQADIENLGDCLRALGDGQSLGDFSLTIVLYDCDKSIVDRLVGEFSGIFTNFDGNLFTETYNQLNAYFATVPGNYAQNLRRLYLLNSNYADLSFLFTILPGEKTNPHLGAEYLAALETDNATPYFLNLHNGEVAHTLILGATGSGKSYLSNFILQNAQKYAPLNLVLDCVAKQRNLTKGLLHELHSILTRHQNTTTAVDQFGRRLEIPLVHGQFKTLPNNPRRPDGSIHEYCPPIHVDSEIDRLLELHASYDDQDPILAAAWLHHRFTQIHPYQDGNGRIARAIVTLVLLRHNLLPLVIDRDLRTEYLDALQKADAKDLSHLVEIFSRLEKNAILQALSLDVDAEVSRQESLVSAVISSLTDKFNRRKAARDAQLLKVNDVARELRELATATVSKRLSELRAALYMIGTPQAPRVDNGGADFGTSHWYKYQVIQTARDAGKYANFQQDHYFTKGSIQLGDDRLVFVVSFHHVGNELTGVMEATAFAELESLEESEERESFAENFRSCSVEPFAFTYTTSPNDVENAFLSWLDAALAVGFKEFGERL